MTETDTSVPNYVYVTYIRASAEQVWHALTDADLTAQLLGARQRLGLATRLDLGAPTRSMAQAVPSKSAACSKPSPRRAW